jgi:hypothetical protein
VLAVIAPPAARNLAVALTAPFGFVIGGGAIPIFISIMGDAGSFAIGFVVIGGLILLGGALVLMMNCRMLHELMVVACFTIGHRSIDAV